MILTKRAVIAAGIAVALIGAIAGHGVAQRGKGVSNADRQADSDGRHALYWYDPMKPDQHFDKPGPSPFMDMPLVARYADEGHNADAGVRIDPTMEQNLGIRLATVDKEMAGSAMEVPGTVTSNQSAIAIIQARTSGFVSRIYSRSPGDTIKHNEALVDLLVPEWAAAQGEFLALLKSGDAALIAAGRERLRLLGMPPELIAVVERTQQTQSTLTISSPIAGVIESLDARQGMAVAAGATIAKIDGIDPIWVVAAVPEALSDLASIGKSARIYFAAYPAETFQGRIVAVLPETNVETHTARVRIELANRDVRIRPGMFAQVRWDAVDPRPTLRVPSEAVIHTGIRTLVILALGDHHFESVEVQIGPESDGRTSIVTGLQEGQKVVVSGQFLIDAEANLRGVLRRLSPAAAPGSAGPTGEPR
jgi:membrane fusion protein, copper/silver efflux system